MDVSGLFYSCDWGTSSFRLRLVERDTCNVVAEASNESGIASVYHDWNTSRKHEDRSDLYRSVLSESITELEKRIGHDSGDVPVVISGMASSSIGWTVLPYKELPVSLDGSEFHYKKIPADRRFPHPVLIISGLCTHDDVLRGEETQVVGALAQAKKSDNALCILPGTHSKHILTSDGTIVDFHTYMTGEIFMLLSRQSILKDSIQPSKQHGLKDPPLRSAFKAGLEEGVHGNLLNAAFKARSRMLLHKVGPEENFYFLSGVVIGTELRHVQQENGRPIVVVGNHELNVAYQIALEMLGMTASVVNADSATIQGQRIMVDHLSSR